MKISELLNPTEEAEEAPHHKNGSDLVPDSSSPTIPYVMRDHIPTSYYGRLNLSSEGLQKLLIKPPRGQEFTETKEDQKRASEVMRESRSFGLRPRSKNPKGAKTMFLVRQCGGDAKEKGKRCPAHLAAWAKPFDDGDPEPDSEPRPNYWINRIILWLDHECEGQQTGRFKQNQPDAECEEIFDRIVEFYE